MASIDLPPILLYPCNDVVKVHPASVFVQCGRKPCGKHVSSAAAWRGARVRYGKARRRCWKWDGRRCLSFRFDPRVRCDSPLLFCFVSHVGPDLCGGYHSWMKTIRMILTRPVGIEAGKEGSV